MGTRYAGKNEPTGCLYFFPKRRCLKIERLAMLLSIFSSMVDARAHLRRTRAFQEHEKKNFKVDPEFRVWEARRSSARRGSRYLSVCLRPETGLDQQYFQHSF